MRFGGVRFRSAWLALLAALASCSPPAPQAQPGPGPGQGPPPVVVAQPLVKRVTEWDEYTGRFAAVERVEVRARVSGYLDSVNFEDGQIVEKGDLLFVIDQRPFQAALDQARAQLSEAEARLQLASNDRERAERLRQSNAISEEEYDQRLQAERQAEAAREAGQAQVRAARLDLEFTQVRAPVTGRISDHAVSVGNLVSGGAAESTLLTTIVSLDPIHFEFTASEAAFLKYLRLNDSGRRVSSRDVANPVFVKLIDEDEFRHEGRMNFVDNQIDPNTGTMRGRAVFDNPDGFLTPGVFGRLRLLGSDQYDAMLIPDSAILSDQSRKFVWVVGADNTVAYRPLELGPVIEGLRVVRGGLAPDEQIIIEGLQRARPGAPVTPQPGKIEPGAPDVVRQSDT